MNCDTSVKSAVEFAQSIEIDHESLISAYKYGFWELLEKLFDEKQWNASKPDAHGAKGVVSARKT